MARWSSSLVTDSYVKGYRDFDVQEAYKACLRAAEYDTTGIVAPISERYHLPDASLWDTFRALHFIPLNYNKKYIHSVFVILCRLYSLTRKFPHYVFDMLQTVVFHSYRILYSNYFVFGIISIYKIETITWCSMHKMDK